LVAFYKAEQRRRGRVCRRSQPIRGSSTNEEDSSNEGGGSGAGKPLNLNQVERRVASR
jgi:hypothetical protein